MYILGHYKYNIYVFLFHILVAIIKTLTGKSRRLIVERSDTIGNLKTKIQEMLGISPHQQKLIFAGRELQDDYRVTTYNIAHRSVIYLVLPENGGQ